MLKTSLKNLIGTVLCILTRIVFLKSYSKS